MALKIEPDFKEALLNLPTKDKEKYFLRLLKKDTILFHRLHFELVSSDTKDDRRNRLESQIKTKIENANVRSANSIKSILRYTSGDITYHVKTTTDKFGEPYLNTVMLISILKKFNPKISNDYSFAAEKLNKYMAARIFKILILVQKLHADEQYDFQEMFQELHQLTLNNNTLKEKLKEANFQWDWLLDFDYPENLNLLVRELRKNKVF